MDTLSNPSVGLIRHWIVTNRLLIARPRPNLNQSLISKFASKLASIIGTKRPWRVNVPRRCRPAWGLNHQAPRKVTNALSPNSFQNIAEDLENVDPDPSGDLICHREQKYLIVERNLPRPRIMAESENSERCNLFFRPDGTVFEKDVHHLQPFL